MSKLVGERGVLPESVAASQGVSIFVEKRITIVDPGAFHQEFGQKALQHLMRNHPQMKVMAVNRNCVFVSITVSCFRFEPLSPWRFVVIHLFQDVVRSTQYMPVAGHVHAEQSDHMANHFQDDHCCANLFAM